MIRENKKNAGTSEIELGFDAEKLRIMKVNFDDKTFAFKSDIAFLPNIHSTIDDARLMFLLSHTWEYVKDKYEYENSFISYTGTSFDNQDVFVARYSKGEVYYIAREKTDDNQLKIHLFRERNNREIGVIRIVHPQLLQDIYSHAKNSTLVNRGQGRLSS